MEAPRGKDLKEYVQITPETELRFVGPFVRPVVTVMTLKNTSDNTLLFKIKTTAPKRYCVRPNIGELLPHAFSRVEICLQPFTYDPNEKNKHKFMVQILVCPDEKIDDLNKMWKLADPDQVMDAKLKCVFDMPVNAVAPEATFYGSSESNKEVIHKDEEKISNLQTTSELVPESLLHELKQLRDDNVGLRKENINLKEQVLMLRSSTAAKPQVDEQYTPLIASQKQIPMFYIAISIAAAVFGILLGKYLL